MVNACLLDQSTANASACPNANDYGEDLAANMSLYLLLWQIELELLQLQRDIVCRCVLSMAMPSAVAWYAVGLHDHAPSRLSCSHHWVAARILTR